MGGGLWRPSFTELGERNSGLETISCSPSFLRSAPFCFWFRARVTKLPGAILIWWRWQLQYGCWRQSRHSGHRGKSPVSGFYLLMITAMHSWSLRSRPPSSLAWIGADSRGSVLPSPHHMTRSKNRPCLSHAQTVGPFSTSVLTHRFCLFVYY